MSSVCFFPFAATLQFHRNFVSISLWKPRVTTLITIVVVIRNSKKLFKNYALLRTRQQTLVVFRKRHWSTNIEFLYCVLQNASLHTTLRITPHAGMAGKKVRRRFHSPYQSPCGNLSRMFFHAHETFFASSRNVPGPNVVQAAKALNSFIRMSIENGDFFSILLGS